LYGVYIAHIIIILKLVMSWKDLSCWWKSYSNMTTLLLGWSHRYRNSTVVIMYWLTVTKYRHHELTDRYKISSSWTDRPLQNIVIMNWLTVTKIPYLKWQWFFSLLHIICLSSIDYCRQDFYWTWLYIWVTQRVSYNKQKLLTLCEYLSSTRLSGVEHVAHILVFCVVFFSFCLSSYCVQCCLCLWIVHSWLFLWFTQMFIPGDFTSSIPLE
jgi:hypothetical protein